MNKKQVVIPINQPGSCCSSRVSVGGCASSCSSTSSCGLSEDANDPSFRLQQEGWVLRTTIGEPRLSEIAENYQAMGHEVHVEYFKASKPASSEGACTTCFDGPNAASANQVWGSIYVRPGKPGQAKDEELY